MDRIQATSATDGFSTISWHVEQRNILERFLTGQSAELPAKELISCTPECMCAKWLYQPGRKRPQTVNLVKQACGACEVFQSMASQALALASIGRIELAREILKDGGIYSEASTEFQRKLALLHLEIADGAGAMVQAADLNLRDAG
jgi:hypothetical protein